MKKILFLLSLAICVSIYASTNLKQNTKAETIAVNGPLDGDKFVAKVKALCIYDDGKYETETREIYKKKNGSNYVYVNFEDYLVRKNTFKTYKKVNVSSYKYYAECPGFTYFFDL